MGPIFGDWEHRAVDPAAGTKAYVNRVTGEISEDPPDEVLEILEARNRQRRPQVYEPTPFRFVPLPADCREQLPDADREEREVETASACRCRGDVGFVDGLGTCPLGDGRGSAVLQVPEHGGSASEQASLPGHVEHIDFLEGDGRGALLRNFLSPAECRNLIEQAEGFGLSSCGYSARIRITNRVSVMGEEVAAELFARARPFLHDIEVWRDDFSGECWPPGIRTDAMSGIWSPVGLNPCFRVCRYDPGGFFLPHFDEGFDYSREHLSLKTFMLYLNDGFEGAPTSFYNHRQRHYVEPDPSNVTYELHPTCGSCVMFNTKITHDGGMLRSGQKYIMRSEVMYQWRGRRSI